MSETLRQKQSQSDRLARMRKLVAFRSDWGPADSAGADRLCRELVAVLHAYDESEQALFWRNVEERYGND